MIQEELYQRGLQAFQEQNIQQGFECLRQAAELNHADALYELGRRYATGFNNVNEEVQCYQKASDLAHPGAMNALGYFLAFRGDSPLPKDPNKALALFEQSYQLKPNRDTLLNLATLYAYGCKDPVFIRDIPKAMTLLIRADREFPQEARRYTGVQLKFRDISSQLCRYVFSYVTSLVDDNQKFQQQIADQQKEIKHLQAQVKYQPEGPGYLEAKEEFETLQTTKKP